MALWFVSIAASTAVVGLTTGGIMLVLGRRFIEEFTRPGVTVEQGTPQWGGWTFPELVVEPPTALQRAVTFPSADGALLRGEFWAQTRSAPTIIISHGLCEDEQVIALDGTLPLRSRQGARDVIECSQGPHLTVGCHK